MRNAPRKFSRSMPSCSALKFLVFTSALFLSSWLPNVNADRMSPYVPVSEIGLVNGKKQGATTDDRIFCFFGESPEDEKSLICRLQISEAISVTGINLTIINKSGQIASVLLDKTFGGGKTKTQFVIHEELLARSYIDIFGADSSLRLRLTRQQEQNEQ